MKKSNLVVFHKNRKWRDRKRTKNGFSNIHLHKAKSSFQVNLPQYKVLINAVHQTNLFSEMFVFNAHAFGCGFSHVLVVYLCGFYIRMSECVFRSLQFFMPILCITNIFSFNLLIRCLLVLFSAIMKETKWPKSFRIVVIFFCDNHKST